MADPTEEELALETEEDLRAKIRLLRTALDRVARALERDGLYADEVAAVKDALEEVVHAQEMALAIKRDQVED